MVQRVGWRRGTVEVRVATLPDVVNVLVYVYADGVLTFTSFREGASRLAVSEHAPEIAIE